MGISRPLMRPWSGRGLARCSEGLAYLFAPRFLWECLTSRTVNPSPAPATSHPACGFPALGAPVCLVPRVMWPIVLGPLLQLAIEQAGSR
jgi:hypothetical protein